MSPPYNCYNNKLNSRDHERDEKSEYFSFQKNDDNISHLLLGNIKIDELAKELELENDHESEDDDVIPVLLSQLECDLFGELI
jgi:CBS domain containing-hemolysin-like protein